MAGRRRHRRDNRAIQSWLFVLVMVAVGMIIGLGVDQHFDARKFAFKLCLDLVHNPMDLAERFVGVEPDVELDEIVHPARTRISRGRSADPPRAR